MSTSPTKSFKNSYQNFQHSRMYYESLQKQADQSHFAENVSATFDNIPVTQRFEPEQTRLIKSEDPKTTQLTIPEEHRYLEIPTIRIEKQGTLFGSRAQVVAANDDSVVVSLRHPHQSSQEQILVQQPSKELLSSREYDIITSQQKDSSVITGIAMKSSPHIMPIQHQMTDLTADRLKIYLEETQDAGPSKINPKVVEEGSPPRMLTNATPRPRAESQIKPIAIEMERAPRVITKLMRYMKFVGYTSFIILSALVMAIISAFLTASYDSRYFHIYGTLLLDGVLHGIFIVVIISFTIAKHEEKHPEVKHGRMLVLHLLVILLSTIICTAFNSRAEDNYAPSAFWPIVAKCIAIVVAMCLYWLYFAVLRCLYQPKASEKNSKEKPKLFAIDIYQNFIEDLKSTKRKLEESMTSNSNQNSGRTTPKIQSEVPRTNFRQMHKTLTGILLQQKKKTVPYLPSLTLIGASIFILLPFGQLAASIGYIMAFTHVQASEQPNLVYLICITYPPMIVLFKKMMFLVNTKFNLELEKLVEFLSLAFAALPYRVLFFSASGIQQSLIIIGLKIGYKLLVYLAYGWHFNRKLQNKHKKHHSITDSDDVFKGRSRTLGRHRTRMMTSVIAFEKDEAKEEKLVHLKNMTKAVDFTLRFITLQFCDVSDIMAFTAAVGIFQGISVVSTLSAIPRSVFEERLLYTGIELICDLCIWILIICCWKRMSYFRRINVTQKVIEFFKELKWVFLSTNSTLFFSVFTIVSILYQ